MKTNKLFDITNKKVLITGSTGGLGSSFAKGMAENGAVVILNGRDTGKLNNQLEQFKKWGFKAHGYAFDVTDTLQINNAVNQIYSEVGTIDVLINNAGINIRAPLENYPDTDWEKVISTNLTAAFKVARAVVKKMIEQRSGKIINIGSMQCELGRTTIAAYAASKGGIKMLTRAMAVDWAKYNIQVNGIGPGYFKTDMTKPLYENPEFDKWLCDRTPSNRWGEPDELIGALIYLSSAASNYTNGQMIYVDGGLLAAI
jgi:gluconate 5-dehydrogenase